MKTLDIGGIIFMAAAWSFIIALNVFTISRILRGNKNKITDTQDIESDLDKMGR